MLVIFLIITMLWSDESTTRKLLFDKQPLCAYTSDNLRVDIPDILPPPK